MRTTLAILVVSLLAGGCSGGSHGGPNGASFVQAQGQLNIPAPGEQTTTVAPSSLTIEATNASTVTIDVTATTADATVDLGYVAPGETVAFSLPEYPSAVQLSATAVTVDALGQVELFAGALAVDGSNYSVDNSFVGVEWAADGSAQFVGAIAAATYVYPAVARK
jgi:hypothetical protein